MITYLNSRNALQYYVLFDKATKLLQEYGDELFKKAIAEDGNYNKYILTTDTSIDENKIYYTYDIDENEYKIVENPVDDEITTYYEVSAGADFTISSLNEYFAYLNDICDAVAQKDKDNPNQEEYDKAFFARLPLDEDVFRINANTREIIVPNSFMNNGVGVLGDELAEIVYFTIDRFFDNVDLANDKVQIAIQWEVNGVKGFSRNFGKDIETIPGKIIFGWPISHELTKNPGSIRFAVRFYVVESNEESNTKELSYSLATLPAVVKIAATLNHNLIDETILEINYGNKITARALNSGIYDLSIDPPKSPLISMPLQVIKNDKYTKDDTIVDLQPEGITLGIGAVPDGAGVVSYQWKMYPYKDGGYDSANAKSLNTNILNDVKDDFIPVTETLTDNDIYYDENRNIVAIQNLSISKTYDSDNGGYQVGDSDTYIQLFRNVSTAKALEAGQYKVDIISRIRVNSVVKLDTRVITIPGPLKPKITTPSDITENGQVHVIFEDEPLTLEALVAKGDEPGRQPSVDLVSEWYRYDSELNNWLKVSEKDEENDELLVYVTTDENNKAILTINNLINTEDKIGDLYKIKATTTRNEKSATVYSDVYRVTHMPMAPSIAFYKTNQWIENGEEGYPEIAYYPTNASEVTLSYGIDKNILTDKLTCIWVKAPIELEGELPYLSTEGLSPEDTILINKINSILDVNPSLVGYPDAVLEIQTNPELKNNKYVTSKTFNRENPGEANIDLYCVIVNELNNNINVTVTPYLRLATR